MDISAFNEFVELAKRLNITETARMLNMSQPTLSKHIISFEKELRLSLFERTGSAMRLTEAGNALLPFAYKILDAQSMFYEEARRIKSEAPARLSVTGLTDETVVMALLGRFITSAESEYGTGFIQVRSCHHKRPIDFVKAGSIDVAFDYFEPSELDDDTVGAVIVGRCPWAAIVDAGHPFANRASIDIEDLRHETLVRIEGAHVSEAWRFIERACLLNGFAPKTRRRYSMRLTDLLTLSSTIGNDVLIAGVNFVKRIEAGLPSSCRVIELTGEATSFPLSALYHIGIAMPCYPCNHCNKCGIFSLKLELTCSSCGEPVKPGAAACPSCHEPYLHNMRRGAIGKPQGASDYYTAQEALRANGESRAL